MTTQLAAPAPADLELRDLPERIATNSAHITAGRAVTQVAADRDALASWPRPVSKRGPAGSYAVAVFAVAGGRWGRKRVRAAAKERSFDAMFSVVGSGAEG